MIEKKLKETGLTFKAGEKLSSSAMVILNDTINELVRNMNILLETTINVNEEEGKPGQKYTLVEVIERVPEWRRVKGIKLRFLELLSSEWKEFVWVGPDWNDIENCWVGGTQKKIIDGGEW